jgi:hypothetical protein
MRVAGPAHKPVTEGAIDQLVAALRDLRKEDRATFERIQEQFRIEGKPTSRTSRGKTW